MNTIIRKGKPMPYPEDDRDKEREAFKRLLEAAKEHLRMRGKGEHFHWDIEGMTKEEVTQRCPDCCLKNAIAQAEEILK